MKKIFFHACQMGAQQYYRSELPVKFCKSPLAHRDILLDLKYGFSAKTDFDYDVYVFHRIISPDFFWTLYKLKSLGKKLVWELDDNYFGTDRPVESTIKPHEIDALRMCLDWSDAIFVSTQNIKDNLPSPNWQSKTFVCPNLVDLESYPTCKLQKPDDTLRIFWGGGITHQYNLELVTPAVLELASEFGDAINFLFVGYVDKDLMSRKLNNITFMPAGVSSELWPGLIRSVRPHVGLAPLTNTPFNNGRSLIKYLEYTASNMVTLASNVLPYNTVKNSVLVDYTSSDLWFGKDHAASWADAIRQCMNLDYRNNLLLSARNEVEENYTWQSTTGLSQWLVALEAVCKI